MAVVIETTVGDITVDLYLDQRPVTCLNFLKLCKMKYYNYNLFHTIRSGFIAQTGDPSGEGSGGQSIFGLLEGPTKRFFSGEKMPKIRHTNAGLLSMVCTDDMMVGSQFFFTLAPDLDSLDGVHCVIGEVTEGHEVLRKLNEVICDENHRPYQDVRITHTVVLEDPFNDPVGFRAPSRSPSPSAERLKGGRIAPDEEIDETEGKSAAEIQEMIEEKEAKARATILEIVGDLPDADIAPPENVLFVCKLNPVTTDEDLEIIFSRFGKIVSCEVIRDKKSGDSLQYAFIEFSDKKSCEDAYFKMDNVLIDDRRIHVDFSQSVSKMRWLGKGRGVKYFNDDEDTKNSHNYLKTDRSQANDRERSGHNNHYNDKNKYKKYDEKTYSNNHQEKRHTSDKNSRKIRERSRSRSKPRASEDSKDDRNNSHSHNSRYKEKSSGEISYKNRDHDTNTHKSKSKYSDHTNSHKSRSKLSPTKHKQESSKSPSRSNKDDSRPFRESDDKHKRKEKREESNIGQNREESKSRLKRKQTDSQSESKLNRKKTRIDQDAHEPRTPSPVTKKNRSEKNKRSKKRTSNAKKKRKPSTSSSDSDSSDSSSSSSDSSSSEDRRKKNKLKRRKRHSSSSSSTDSSPSSSSSSTSSDSSSDSSSSSSDSEPNRRKKSKKSSKTNMTKRSKKK